MSMTLESFEMAALVAYDPTPPATPADADRKRQCQALCERILADAASWELCLGVLTVTTKAAAKFFCLQVGARCRVGFDVWGRLLAVRGVLCDAGRCHGQWPADVLCVHRCASTRLPSHQTYGCGCCAWRVAAGTVVPPLLQLSWRRLQRPSRRCLHTRTRGCCSRVCVCVCVWLRAWL
jgi:hypothetical protein